MKKTKKNNKPAHEVRFGCVKAAIWRAQTGEIVRYNVTFTRLYKEGESWKSSASFSRDDLPKLATVAAKAYEWILTSAATA